VFIEDTMTNARPTYDVEEKEIDDLASDLFISDPVNQDTSDLFDECFKVATRVSIFMMVEERRFQLPKFCEHAVKVAECQKAWLLLHERLPSYVDDLYNKTTGFEVSFHSIRKVFDSWLLNDKWHQPEDLVPTLFATILFRQ